MTSGYYSSFRNATYYCRGTFEGLHFSTKQKTRSFQNSFRLIHRRMLGLNPIKLLGIIVKYLLFCLIGKVRTREQFGYIF